MVYRYQVVSVSELPLLLHPPIIRYGYDRRNGVATPRRLLPDIGSSNASVPSLLDRVWAGDGTHKTSPPPSYVVLWGWGSFVQNFPPTLPMTYVVLVG